jgi:hypothetical protein
MERYKWIIILKFLGLFLAIFGVVLYRHLPEGWYLLAWIPISFGYGIYYRAKEFL